MDTGKDVDATARRSRVAPLAAPFLILLLSVFGAAAEGEALRVGHYENHPKVFTGPDGRPAGIFPDFLAHVAKAEGWRVEYVPGTFAEGLARLASGEIDLMPDVARTPERAARFTFHRIPVLNSWSQVYAPDRLGIASILDLAGRRVAVLAGSVQEQAFARFAKGFGLDLVAVSYPDFESMFAAAARGEVDAVVTNRFFGLRHAERYGLAETPVMFDPSDLYVAGRPGFRSGSTPRSIATSSG